MIGPSRANALPRRTAALAAVLSLFVLAALAATLRAASEHNLSQLVAHVEGDDFLDSDQIPSARLLDLCADIDGCIVVLKAQKSVAGFSSVRRHLFFRSGSSAWKTA